MADMAKITQMSVRCPTCRRSWLKKIDPASLRAVREARGISLRSMADSMDMSPAYLSDVELGKRNVTERVLAEYRKLEGSR